MTKSNWSMRACGIFLLWAAAAVTLPAQTTVASTVTFTTLHSFDGTDGADTIAGLVQATSGDLYGTTSAGGPNDYCGEGCGTVFKITPDGALTTLHSFCIDPASKSSCEDGAVPYAGLVQITNGDFYGTTLGGGTTFYGTVFKITANGTLTRLLSFDDTDGSEPYAGLVWATDGGFYGTTEYGGANGAGTVFKITTNGTLTTLYTFCPQGFPCTDGAEPGEALVQDANGMFYGTTDRGGANNDGTIFKINPNGVLTTLYSFCSQSNCTDGEFPNGLVQATDGDFYGTTYGGGANGQGTVFKITPNSRTLTTLHSFDFTDGSEPYAGLIQASDGNFYGTTELGGAASSGTVFKITPIGTLTTLYSFCTQVNNGVCTDGYLPYAGLVQATNGDFYGTTYHGGANGNAYGTVFSLSAGLGPFVETQPTSGKVGVAVKILGTSLTGATSVAFNGTAAPFTMVSKTLITTTVPSGATTGTVQVVTPGGTLSSNVPFQVLP
jgi:uncharacterized repeat protein (TIGR03803 family)